MSIKRHQTIQTSTESEILKELRLKSSLSIQKLADKMEVSKTRVAQMEGGRGHITDEYVKKFLSAVGVGWADWLSKIGGSSEYDDLKSKCYNVIDKLPFDELEKLYRFINDYVVIS